MRLYYFQCFPTSQHHVTSYHRRSCVRHTCVTYESLNARVLYVTFATLPPSISQAFLREPLLITNCRVTIREYCMPPSQHNVPAFHRRPFMRHITNVPASHRRPFMRHMYFGSDVWIHLDIRVHSRTHPPTRHSRSIAGGRVVYHAALMSVTPPSPHTPPKCCSRCWRWWQMWDRNDAVAPWMSESFWKKSPIYACLLCCRTYLCIYTCINIYIYI